VPTLEEGLNKLPGMRVEPVPQKVCDIKVAKIPLLHQPSEVGRRDGLLAVKRGRVERSGRLTREVLAHALLVESVKFSNLLFCVLRYLVSTGRVILNAKAKIIDGRFSRSFSSLATSPECHKSVEATGNNVLNELFRSG